MNDSTSLLLCAVNKSTNSFIRFIKVPYTLLYSSFHNDTIDYIKSTIAFKYGISYEDILLFEEVDVLKPTDIL